MNILYDITMLGAGCTKKGSAAGKRTGIFRVVEEVAQQLVTCDECRLTFYSEREFMASVEYLRSNPALQNVAMPDASRLHRFNAQAAYRLRDHQRRRQAVQKAFDYGHRLLRLPQLTMNARSLAHADIVHSTYYAFPPQARAARNVQRVLTVYDLIPILLPQYCPPGPREVLEAALASLGPEDWVIAISQATKDDLCNHLKMDPARIFLTPLAADPSVFYPCHDAAAQQAVRQRYGIPEGRYALTLSTLEVRKNIRIILRSFARLLEQEPANDLFLVLAGVKGWDYDALFKDIPNASALQKRIVVTGFVADEDLAALYSGAQAFLYMSLYEGFGLPPLEAMQCGVPVITSNTSSLPEVVGEAGRMLAPDDADGLCQTLLDVSENAALRAQMARQSRERAQLFSWQRCGQETIKAYHQALGK